MTPTENMQRRLGEVTDRAGRDGLTVHEAAIWSACKLLFDPDGDNAELAISTMKALHRARSVA